MTERPLLLDEELPRETGDLADAIASVPPSSGYRALLQTLFRGQMSAAAIALVIRQIVVMALSVGSSVAVSRWLGPEIVGRFAILIFVTQGILGYFGDLGLKAALIRKRGDLEATELASAQKVILGISITFALVIGALLPVALPLVKLGPENYFPAIVFLVLLIVRNQRMVPLALLERAMRFKVVSAVEAGESLIYTVLLATLAFLHQGIWCYVVAMGCRDLFGSLAFNLIARPPFRKFSWASIRPHVGFSLVYQGGSLLNMATLAFPPIMIASLLGKNAVGYVSWASTLSLYPLVICNAMARIYLPAFSSAASDPTLLKSRVEKSLRINASIAWPACAVLASLSTPIIALVFTDKWLPAQSLLYAYCVTAVFTAVGVPLSELFFAQDDAWFNLRLCLWWTIPTWTLGTYTVYHYGLYGFAIFQAVLQITWLLAFFHARRMDGLSVFAPLREPLLLSAALVLGNFLMMRSFAISSIYRLAGLLAVEGAICAVFLLRMVMSWRAGAGDGDAAASPA
ncbi:MAG: oligosaccharide flippase family protein [Terriglobales bacterium]|jgi:O-antigen/teichoic acid export membrane protein